MITSLYIKDFALIDELDVEFGNGLNILTGQTGAGKSIIIGALNMILGERADTDVIRQGSRKAIAEATIRVGRDPSIRRLLQENEVEILDELILRREIRESGSRAFINDTPVTISVLKKVGDHLVDLHGQHDHQYLLREEHHGYVIDSFKDAESALEDYRTVWNEMSGLRKRLDELRRREAELREKSELYRFQVRELEAAELDPEKEQEQRAEMKRLDHAEELDSRAGALVAMGDGEDDIDLPGLIRTMSEHLRELSKIEPEFDTYRDEVKSARIAIQEAIQFAERYRSRIEFNPGRLEELRRRQTEIRRLEKKYGRSMEELVRYLETIREELNLSENYDLEIGKLENEIEKSSTELKKRAVALHEGRHRTGERLSREMEQKLSHLGIPHPQFRVQVDWIEDRNGWIEIDGQPVECRADGCDEIRFQISTNRGEDPKPLAKIASGGEISRVMLGLKSVLANKQRLPVMIFDEIDSGISGRISEKVGRAMRQLSDQCQIIAITHQPQIASHAHHHFQVQKVETNGRTVTHIQPLDDGEHIREIASLMSGEQISEAAIASAKELVEKHQAN